MPAFLFKVGICIYLYFLILYFYRHTKTEHNILYINNVKKSRPDRQSFYYRKTKRKSCKTLVLRDFFYGYQPSSPTRFFKSGYFGSGLKPSGSKATLRLSTLPHNYLSVASASECQFVAGSAYCIGCNRYNGRPGGV